MDAQVAEYSLVIPERLSDEPAAPLRLRMKMTELGLQDSRLIDSLGIWQANAVLDQLRAAWLAEREAQAEAQRRRQQLAMIALVLMVALAAAGSAMWFLRHA